MLRKEKIISILSKTALRRIKFFLLTMGPGIVVMLADTDAGSLITAAQSGAMFGYKLIAVQLVLIPILYITQELTVRLGIGTGMGHGGLIKIYFGKFWAKVSVITLLICCIGAIVSEMSGIASVGMLFGIPIWLSIALTAAFLFWLVISNSYLGVERIALAIGAFELVYLFIAFVAHSHFHEVTRDLLQFPIHNKQYLYLTAANIGAVIMPWMIFYQQSAVVDKGLKPEHMKSARIETFVGALATQTIMIAVIMAVAATIGKSNPGASLTSIGQISNALIPFLGVTVGKTLFALGMLGASLIATIVVALTAAWSLAELKNHKCSLTHCPREAPYFYSCYVGMVLIGSALFLSKISLVELNVAIEVMNSLLLPLVLLFLFLLARKALPEKYRLQGWYAWLVGIIFTATSAFTVVATVLSF